jgi:predicted nucleic acid-binding protein
LAQNSACQPTFDAILDLLDPGERAAILLAQELNADLLLLDDMKARRTATERGLAITGWRLKPQLHKQNLPTQVTKPLILG